MQVFESLARENKWGSGSSKPLASLLTEVREGETVIEWDARGKPIRVLSLTQVLIERPGRGVLIEIEQSWRGRPGGRRRGLIPCEKMTPGELPADAAIRCAREELGIELLNPREVSWWTERIEAASFPGLMCRYVKFLVEGDDNPQIPDEDFWREDPSSANIEANLFGWRSKKEVSYGYG
jgi:ADP-ribose pyrophosphatase YjhB (NUDIX family)